MGKCLSLFLLLLAFYFEEQLGSVNHSALSFTKGGNIRIGSCDFEQVLFNSSIASEWSCEDATTYTWRHDFDGVLRSIGLRPADHERLLASAGFCPHKRCQLDNASTSGASEFCPPGKCNSSCQIRWQHLLVISSGLSCSHNISLQACATQRLKMEDLLLERAVSQRESLNHSSYWDFMIAHNQHRSLYTSGIVLCWVVIRVTHRQSPSSMPMRLLQG